MGTPLASAGALTALMAGYYRDCDAAARDPARRVAWCTSVGPAELLRALGFEVFFPENHAAMLGASRLATDLIPAANAAGYSPEICSYLTSDIGAWLKGVTPLSKAVPGIAAPPRPDVLVFQTNQCRDVGDWFAWYGRRLGVPVLGVEGFRGVGEVTDDHVAATAARLRALVPPLEAIAGRPLDPERFRDVVAASRETSRLWGEVLATAAARPAPLTFFDGCIQMGPAVCLRGDSRANDYYRGLLAELQARVAAGTGAVPGERVRLFWDGMPVWGRLRSLSTLLEGLGASVVASTYCSSWVFDALDPDRPFEGLARASVELFITRTDDVKERMLADMARRFAVDAVVYHDARTCPNNTNCRYGLPSRLGDALGLPWTVIHGDLNDLRCHNDDSTRLSLEALVEGLGPGVRR